MQKNSNEKKMNTIEIGRCDGGDAVALNIACLLTMFAI